MAARKVYGVDSPIRRAMKKANKELLQAYRFEREAMGLQDISQGALRKRGGPQRSRPRQAWRYLLRDLRSF